MESYSLLGIPYPLIGFFCFILSAIFIFVWPKSKAKEFKTLNFPKYVLHYFHPLAWVLIGMAAFFQRSSIELMILFVGLGALVFGMFIFMLVRG